MRETASGLCSVATSSDALVAAAEFALGIEEIARRTRGLVATIGAMHVSPGAANVIPGEVTHTLDVRHADVRVRRQALMASGRLATQIAERRGIAARHLIDEHGGGGADAHAGDAAVDPGEEVGRR